MLMNSRGGPSILRGGPALGIISMDFVLKVKPFPFKCFHNLISLMEKPMQDACFQTIAAGDYLYTSRHSA